MISFDPDVAKKFGVNEAILLQYIKENLKHTPHFKFMQPCISLSRYDWIFHLYFFSEYEYEQAIENLIRFGLLYEKENLFFLMDY